MMTFGLNFKRSTCVGHLQCPIDSCEYMSQNRGAFNNAKWISITFNAFVVVKGHQRGLGFNMRFVIPLHL